MNGGRFALLVAALGCNPGQTNPARATQRVALGDAPGPVPDTPDAPVTTVATRAEVGPYEAAMLPGRSVWYALPRAEDEHRLIAGIHGQCGGPSYACAAWLDAGVERGFMVCPTGNEHCTSPVGPPMWDESFPQMDQDLERGLQVASQRTDGGFSRQDAVLFGYSRGGWAAIDIVRMHPGRWPYLVLVEADVTIHKAYLEAAKVRSVAMVAGAWGTELPGDKKSVEDMKALGYPAELFVMPKTAHLYSDNFDEIMRQALAFVLSH